mmetsp:Transcript_1032/g.2014  ORF Transcript_1032/g.2014 Transcript_1032/m.2014 type:complete len:212 (+) Transcript_1032:1009-1644(+)
MISPAGSGKSFKLSVRWARAHASSVLISSSPTAAKVEIAPRQIGPNDWASSRVLPRHMFEKTQAMLRRMDIDTPALLNIKTNIGSMTPKSITSRRYRSRSPAILPKAQMACSLTSLDWAETTRFARSTTTPLSMMNLVCSLVPEAMFVIAHAASNCIAVFWLCRTHATRPGIAPQFMTSWIGGSLSNDRALRIPMTDCSFTSGLCDARPST